MSRQIPNIKIVFWVWEAKTYSSLLKFLGTECMSSLFMQEIWKINHILMGAPWKQTKLPNTWIQIQMKDIPRGH